MGTVLSKSVWAAVAVLYPSYLTFKAIEARQLNDDHHWMCYWVAYGLLHSLEHFTQGILRWLPLFRVAKLALMLWLMSPSSKGALHMYTAFIRPLLLRHEATIDSALADGKQHLSAAAARLRAYLVLAALQLQDKLAQYRQDLQRRCAPDAANSSPPSERDAEAGRIVSSRES